MAAIGRQVVCAGAGDCVCGAARVEAGACAAAGQRRQRPSVRPGRRQVVQRRAERVIGRERGQVDSDRVHSRVHRARRGQLRGHVCGVKEWRTCAGGQCDARHVHSIPLPGYAYPHVHIQLTG